MKSKGHANVHVTITLTIQKSFSGGSIYSHLQKKNFSSVILCGMEMKHFEELSKVTESVHVWTGVTLMPFLLRFESTWECSVVRGVSKGSGANFLDDMRWRLFLLDRRAESLSLITRAITSLECVSWNWCAPIHYTAMTFAVREH